MSELDVPVRDARRIASEALGTALLLAAVVGSGVMGERLAGGNDAMALLANTLATGSALIVLIETFGPLSGAHFNPLVTLASALQRQISGRLALRYIAAQLAGAFAGVALAHAMFGEPLFSVSAHDRSGAAQMLGEAVATFGLLTVILIGSARHSRALSWSVGLYITAAYWFTSSTSFANPAVTLARSASDTFCGIRPSDVPGFIVAQALGAAAAFVGSHWLVSKPNSARATTNQL